METSLITVKKTPFDRRQRSFSISTWTQRPCAALCAPETGGAGARGPYTGWGASELSKSAQWSGFIAAPEKATSQNTVQAREASVHANFQPRTMARAPKAKGST